MKMPERELPADPLRFIRECVQKRRVLWTYHVNMRLEGRFIPREAVLGSVESYEIIEAYPEDKYLPTYLVLGRSASEAFHVLFAADLDGDNVRVVTAYRPGGAEWEDNLKTKESTAMKCTVCGAEMRSAKSDLPFKTTQQTIVILKSLPVLQCENCAHYLIEDAVLGRVDKILATSNSAAELEIVPYAA